MALFNLRPNSTTTVSEGAQSLAAADFDDDGDWDLVVTSADAGTVSMLRNDGQGDFLVDAEFDVAPIDPKFTAAGQSPQVVATGNFDGIGPSDDFAVAHFAFGVTAYFNGFPSQPQTLSLNTTAATPDPSMLVPDSYVESFDVDKDGYVVPLDALLVINALNVNGPRAVGSDAVDSLQRLDTSGDGFLSPVDALLVINSLSSRTEPIISPGSSGRAVGFHGLGRGADLGWRGTQS